MLRIRGIRPAQLPLMLRIGIRQVRVKEIEFTVLSKDLYISCADVRVLLLAFAGKNTQPKALNYIPTSWSCDGHVIHFLFSNVSKFSSYI